MIFDCYDCAPGEVLLDNSVVINQLSYHFVLLCRDHSWLSYNYRLCNHSWMGDNTGRNDCVRLYLHIQNSSFLSLHQTGENSL